jgi:dTDP-4-amino-4,6-dideoxygalactose transaminase
MNHDGNTGMVRLIKPYIAFKDIEAEFREIFESGIFTRGKYSEAFPEALRDYVGAKYAFNATSATTALSACLDILGIGQGDDVIVSDFSFPATANVVEACGARPIFADVSLETFNMTTEELERRLTPQTKAVIFVCAFGDPDGIQSVESLCKAKNIPLIVDAACGLGSRVEGRRIGAIGDLSCFSFHPRKLLTSGEGGAITTDNEEYANRLRVKLFHGAEIIDGKMEYVSYGFNYRLPELQCVMLIKQIAVLDEIIGRRNAAWETYKRILEPKGFFAQKHSDECIHNLLSVVFAVPKDVARDSLITEARNRGVETTLGTYCQSGGKYFREKYGDIQPNSLWLEQNTLTVPCHDDMDAANAAERIKDAIHGALKWDMYSTLL